MSLTFNTAVFSLLNNKKQENSTNIRYKCKKRCIKTRLLSQLWSKIPIYGKHDAAETLTLAFYFVSTLRNWTKRWRAVMQIGNFCMCVSFLTSACSPQYNIDSFHETLKMWFPAVRFVFLWPHQPHVFHPPLTSSPWVGLRAREHQRQTSVNKSWSVRAAGFLSMVLFLMYLHANIVQLQVKWSILIGGGWRSILSLCGKFCLAAAGMNAH